jgi:hypothetical protein
MRLGFDQFCPFCAYSIYVDSVGGRCICKRFMAIVKRKRFPPTHANAVTPNTCRYYRDKS